MLERDDLETGQRVGGVLQVFVAGAERRQDRIEIGACGRPRRSRAAVSAASSESDACVRCAWCSACAIRGARPPDAVPRLVEQHLGRAQHRVIGRRAAGAGGREHQQARELGGHVTQAFELGTRRENVRDREVVERVGHGHGLYKQKGWRPFSPQPSALCASTAYSGLLEVHLHAELPEPRLQHARRRQPRARARPAGSSG